MYIEGIKEGSFSIIYNIITYKHKKCLYGKLMVKGKGNKKVNID